MYSSLIKNQEIKTVGVQSCWTKLENFHLSSAVRIFYFETNNFRASSFPTNNIELKFWTRHHLKRAIYNLLNSIPTMRIYFTWKHFTVLRCTVSTNIDNKVVPSWYTNLKTKLVKIIMNKNSSIRTYNCF